MKANVGSVDKSVRIFITIIIIGLFIARILTGVTAVVLLAVAAILIMTSVINFCPIWFTLGVSTKKEKIN